MKYVTSALVTSLVLLVTPATQAETLDKQAGDLSKRSNVGTFTISADKVLNIELTTLKPVLAKPSKASSVVESGVLSFSTTSQGLEGPIVVMAADGYRHKDGHWSPKHDGILDETIIFQWDSKDQATCVNKTTGQTMLAHEWRFADNNITDALWCEKGYDFSNFLLGVYAKFDNKPETTPGTYTLQLIATEYNK